MAAYMIIAAKINDREKFIAGYGAQAAQLVAKFGGEYVYVLPGAELLEGTLEGYSSVALSKWPSKEAAMKFWNSDEYIAVKKLREGVAEVQVQLVEAPE